MVLLCALWGFQQAAIKLIAGDVSLLMQAAIRSGCATLLVVAWGLYRGIPLFSRDGTLWAGIGAGLLFGAEFALIYGGLGHTNVSRMTVFIYLAPPLTALGLHFFVRGERLAPLQWGGVFLAFAGLALAFSEGFATEKTTWFGDLCGVGAALLWAATTVLIRTTKLAGAEPAKTLLYQLAVSAVFILASSLLLGEKGVTALTPGVLASLAYQTVIVAFASYLAWFWLLSRYLAARLSVLSFLTPMFGVLSGVLFLGESLSGRFVLAALLIGAGIVLVNRRS
ncbi:MAG TPA: DMT family transporter [Burkholderiales bacterium]|jgi:drug/metabolite transporter (DMT)-like permease